MKRLNKVTVTGKDLEKFAANFIAELNSLKDSLRTFNIELDKALPKALNGGNVAAKAVYSHDHQHVLIMFKRSNEFQFESEMCMGDVFNTLDPSGTWKKQKNAFFRIEGSNISLKNVELAGGWKPFELFGDSIDIIIEDLKIEVPYLGIVNIDYALVFSSKVFHEKVHNLRQYVDDLSKIYWDYFKEDNPKEIFMQKHERIKQEMERLFFDESILEQEIDNFISENDVILEQCLGLINPLRQVKLENIHGDNPKDFKPDLIAYNQDEKVWKVVDYKRAKRNIIRNNEKARAHFKAEVTELEAQLDDYLEYFKDKGQQKHFQEKYNYLIEYPGAIGLIGNISYQEEREFNRIKRRLPRWLDIIPYNYLYDRYCRYLETVRQVMNS
ncbi:hypothetical protein bcere0019_36830 [Bacillus cereus Rock3-28]|nr:hypothetical protein bcere0019_36830 [Bacillus cereus Rock3-28]